MKYRLGTRKSALAQTQSNWIREKLEKVGVFCDLVVIESEGDKSRSLPLYELEPLSPGLFTKQLEDALLRNQIDLAVHSLKDLPTTQPDELTVAAIPPRADPSDCLLVHEELFQASELLFLPKEARIGTSSLRREALLLSHRPDLLVSPIRGNLPTRIRLAQEKAVDAVVVATAGLCRLNIETRDLRRIPLSITDFVPAPGQGALAVEVRKNCVVELVEALKILHDETTAMETRVERALLKALLGGCTLPFGARCRVDSTGFHCRAFIGVSEDRKENKHHWKSFHYFDFHDASEQALVSMAVQQIKEALEGLQHHG